VEDVAAESEVSTVILYRHFESKADLFRVVLRRAEQRLVATTGSPRFTADSLAALVAAAGQEPDGFRLLFRQAEREPEFRSEMSRVRRGAVVVTRRSLGDLIPDPAWADWAASLLPTVAIEGVISWLDAGQPDREEAARRIGAAVQGVIEAARSQRTS
jgi:AcrR family transcriptional regulator